MNGFLNTREAVERLRSPRIVVSQHPEPNHQRGPFCQEVAGGQIYASSRDRSASQRGPGCHGRRRSISRRIRGCDSYGWVSTEAGVGGWIEGRISASGCNVLDCLLPGNTPDQAVPPASALEAPSLGVQARMMESLAVVPGTWATSGEGIAARHGFSAHEHAPVEPRMRPARERPGLAEGPV